MHKMQFAPDAPRASAMVRLAAIVGAACGTFGVAAGAAHGSFVATLGAYGPGQYASCGYRASYAWDSTASLNFYNIRSFQHEFVESTGGDETASVLRTWCVQVYQGVTVGQTYDFDVVPVESVPSQGSPGPMGLVRANVMRDLFSRWIDSSTGYVVGDEADRNAKSAAFQLAVWEISHENFGVTDEAGLVSRMSLGLGAFRSTPSSAAQVWYAAIQQSLGANGFQSFDVQGLAHPTAQDQVYAPLTPVPAPAALGVLCTAGLIGHRRRR
jgi:hypothetical protein